ncbi:MAG: 8-amino-7-oxononanoate synthase [Ignavibacteria bacterium]|nr:MAG: 8-amino-7-oxononanoate synthase [Ignavibacteria bacterium]KAF0161802.1 MAG: 8-amino-7-oxononanoate synthase [Ignavibacteria bacterium]
MKDFENELEKQFLMESAPGAYAMFNGKLYSYFGGTSYYELHKNDLVINSAVNAVKQYGISSSSSRNSFGATQLIVDVENEAANYFDCEDAVYLASGFLTDQAAIQALLNQNLFDVIFMDEISHYSNEYASRLSGKPVHTFSHLNPVELEDKVTTICSGNLRPLIITDGIFPIFGNLAPLDKYIDIAEKHNGIVWIDDAHAVGVLGENGKGTIEHYKVSCDRLYFGATFSKAFGGYGGIIPGKKDFIKEIKCNQIFSGATPVPSPAAAASLTGMKLLKTNHELRKQLWDNAKKLKSGLQSLGLNINNTHVPIAAWSMSSKSKMQNLQNELMRKGILIQYVQYVGAGEMGALRIVVFSTHTTEQIDNLIDELRKTL